MDPDNPQPGDMPPDSHTSLNKKKRISFDDRPEVYEIPNRVQLSRLADFSDNTAEDDNPDTAAYYQDASQDSVAALRERLEEIEIDFDLEQTKINALEQGLQDCQSKCQAAMIDLERKKTEVVLSMKCLKDHLPPLLAHASSSFDAHKRRVHSNPEEISTAVLKTQQQEFTALLQEETRIMAFYQREQKKLSRLLSARLSHRHALSQQYDVLRIELSLNDSRSASSSTESLSSRSDSSISFFTESNQPE